MPSRKRWPSCVSYPTIASQPSDSTYSTAATKPASSSCCCVPCWKRFPTGLVVGGAHLVRPQALEELALAEREPHVGAEELVRRAEENVDVPAGDVDPAVRPVVDSVRPGERACAVRQLDHPRDVRRRPDRVRGDRKGDDARPLGELRLEVVEVEREIVVDAREADDDAEILLEREPRRHVRVVVEARAHDLVPLPQLSAERPREQEVERRHALPEGNLVRMAGEEAAGGGAGTLDQLDGANARLVRRADVRVVLAQVSRDRLDHLVRALRPARPVEEREPAVERAIARADGSDIQQGRAHATSSPLTVQR